MIAYGALLLWPLISLGLFLSMPTPRAILWSLLISYLFLPNGVGFDIPGLPFFDKNRLPGLVMLFFAIVMSKPGEFKWPKSTGLNVLLLLLLFSPIITGFLNRDPITTFGYTKPAVDFYTSFTSSAERFFRAIPFILGVGFLRKESSHRDILYALAGCALIYSVLVIIEIRLSPQLARWVYGQSSGLYFLQQIRGGGFRSSAFLGHGLLVSNFLAIAVIATAGLARMRKMVWGIPAGLLVVYLGIVLVLNKSLGALLLALLIVPAVYFMRQRAMLLAAVIAGLFVLTYPITRTIGLIPTSAMESVAGSYSADRAQSYAFRTKNEDALLARAGERPLFGWGPFARWRIRELNAMGQTDDASTADGLWIILMGQYGFAGFIGMLGLFFYPIWRAFRLSKRQALPLTTFPLVGILVYQLLNALPNAGFTPLTWLVGGALTGLMAQSGSTVVRRPRTIGPRGATGPATA